VFICRSRQQAAAALAATSVEEGRGGEDIPLIDMPNENRGQPDGQE